MFRTYPRLAVGRSLSITVTMALALLAVANLPAADRIVALFSNAQYGVWKTTSEGMIAPFPYEFPATPVPPLPSPNGRWIVFSRDNPCAAQPFHECGRDLHLLNVESGHDQRITNFGQPQGERYASVEVVTFSWSADSSRILFAVTPGETSGAAEEWGHDLLVWKADYGFHIYDLATATIRSAALPKNFELQAWLPDGSFLGSILQSSPSSARDPCAERLLKFRSGDSQGADIGAPSGSLDQVKVSSNGKRVIGYLEGQCQQPETAQIVKIDLATMSATPVVPLAAWAENQWPGFSPDGDHISYVHTERLVAGIPDQSLIVDGQLLYSCHGSIDYQWVDEQTIAAACETEVVVLDAAIRAVLSRLTVPAAR